MIKKILIFIIPPILRLQGIYRIINFVIRVKDKISYEKNLFKRQAFINRAIKKFKDCNYLEIGGADDSVFNTLKILPATFGGPLFQSV